MRSSGAEAVAAAAAAEVLQVGPLRTAMLQQRVKVSLHSTSETCQRVMSSSSSRLQQEGLKCSKRQQAAAGMIRAEQQQQQHKLQRAAVMLMKMKQMAMAAKK